MDEVENKEEIIENEVEEVFESEEENHSISITGKMILSVIFYVIGAICIFFSIKYYCSDLTVYGDSQYRFEDVTYVGGDAYNYIISASRSAAVMTKSLIWAVFGCSSIIIGRLFSK